MAKNDTTPQFNPDTIIGSNVKIKGNLVSEGDVNIDGLLNGNIKAEGNIAIGGNGRVVGSLIGRSVIISGSLTGNINATEDTHITATGDVSGDITTITLHIEKGAVFIGASKMKQPTPIAPEEA